MSLDKRYLDKCLQLAGQARAEGESPVGSLVVINDKVVGEAYEKSRQLNDVTRHAEVLAILNALKKTDNLEQAVLYTNVEPCVLCSYAIRHYKIKKVVFIKYSGQLGGTNPLFDVLTNNNVKSWSPSPEIIVYKES